MQYQQKSFNIRPVSFISVVKDDIKVSDNIMKIMLRLLSWIGFSYSVQNFKYLIEEISSCQTPKLLFLAGYYWWMFAFIGVSYKVQIQNSNGHS